MEKVISQTTLAKQLKLMDMHITPHHSEWWTHHMNNKAFYHRGSPRLNGSFYGTVPHDYYSNGLLNFNITANHPEAILFAQARAAIYEGNLLLSVMIEQTIRDSALSSIKTFDDTKSKFEAWAESIENAAQICGEVTLHIAFSKMTGSPLSAANRLKAWSLILTLMELKRVLLTQYSAIPYDRHAMQAFAWLEQGLD